MRAKETLDSGFALQSKRASPYMNKEPQPLPMSLTVVEWAATANQLVICVEQVGETAFRKLFVSKPGDRLLDREILQILQDPEHEHEFEICDAILERQAISG
jgi:hypothetical protein